MADWIWMPFGLLGPRMRQMVGIGDCPTSRGNFRGVYGHPSVTSRGTFWHSYARLHERSSCHLGCEWDWPRHWCIRWQLTFPKEKGRFWAFWVFSGPLV